MKSYKNGLLSNAKKRAKRGRIVRLSIAFLIAAIFAVLFFVLVYFYKKGPVFYIILSAILGVVLKL